MQSMVDSVYQSRKVLAVWSVGYASSRYCMQELDYAIQRSFQNSDCSVRWGGGGTGGREPGRIGGGRSTGGGREKGGKRERNAIR